MRRRRPAPLLVVVRDHVALPTMFALGVMTICLAACVGHAADPVTRALATPVTATWTSLPLRPAAARLSDIGGIAVVIDRRIDPDTPITLDVSAESLADVLARVAAAAHAEVATYAGHVRLVPRGRAAALAAADRSRAGELRGLPPRARDAVLPDAIWSWPDGAVPRDLVASAAAEGGISLTGLDDLPHDHFPAARLPTLSLADRLDLLLAHVDRRVEWKPRSARGRAPLVFQLVDIVAAGADSGVVSTGTAVPPPARRPALSRPPRGDATYTLTVAAPLDELLATLARRFGLTLALDRDSLAGVGVAPADIVRLELKDVSREQLLEAILAPRGLTWRIDDDTLSVAAPRP